MQTLPLIGAAPRAARQPPTRGIASTGSRLVAHPRGLGRGAPPGGYGQLALSRANVRVRVQLIGHARNNM